MNTQRLARLRISPLHMQQVLFASLALMVTLIAAQQFNHWNLQQEVGQIRHEHVHNVSFAKVTALHAKDVALSLQSVDEAAAADESAPRQQSWVF